MEITKAEKNHAQEISELMLSDLKYPDKKFPKKLVMQFREHAQEKNILKEFENENLIAFVAIEKKIIGFIVGYQEETKKAMIHYICSNDITIKKTLLLKFIEECKIRKISEITADSFEFMENDSLFKNNNFLLIKKEKLAPELDLLWYKFGGKNEN